MKIYISYFAQMRNFPKNLIALSTAIYNPRWLPLGRDQLGHIWLDIPPLKPGYECNGLCHGPECEFKQPDKCEFLQAYRRQLDKLNINEIVDKLKELKEDIEIAEGLENVEFVLLVYEVPENLCSERVVLKQWFKDNEIELEEWSKK